MVLTIDENKIRDLAAEKLSTREIGIQLGVSTTTIARRMRKLRIKSQAKSGIKTGSKPRICRLCGETNIEKFRYQTVNNKSYSKCKDCHASQQMDRYSKNRKETLEYAGGCCCICGYNRCIAALHFHHKDRHSKDPQWKLLRHRPLKEIKKEIDKCILVCSNCHAEIHAGMTEFKSAPYHVARPSK